MSAPETSAPAARLAGWLEGLEPSVRDDLARRYTLATEAAGATVRRPDGHAQAIPPLLTPEVLDGEKVRALEANAHALAAALCRLTGWLMTSDRAAPLRRRVFAAFGPLERVGLERTWREAERLATARVDYLVDEGGTPRALEVNATIPAMQGYSDLVAAAFVREVARARGVDLALVPALLDENGRNGDQLLDSLVAHHRLLVEGARPGPSDDGQHKPAPGGPLRIAVVHRDGDSQEGELRYLARRFGERGHDARLATPARLRFDGRGRLVTDDGFAPDLVYRHVFARRLDPDGVFARALLEPRRHRILNPIASHLEVKAMLGLLSEAADAAPPPFAAEIGLDEPLVDEIRRSVPWTRLLAPGATRGPAGEAIADLVRTVAGEPERFVLKRSWDYGGKSVFLGADYDEGAARRASEALGRDEAVTPPPSWAELSHAAAVDPRDAWIVQALVPSRRHRHLVASTGGATWKELYVDLSIYTSLGVTERPCGGVSRAAIGRIVNLQGGGGLAPLIRERVLERLLAGR